jgi:hypothetical protein
MGQNQAQADWPASLVLGYVLTGVWLLSVGGFVACDWTALSTMKPNEIGDFAAGAAAPLAFLWLVVAVFLQKTELGLQRTELKESREAQQLLARETGALAQQNAEAVRVAQATYEEQHRAATEARLERLVDMIAERVVLRSPELMIRKEGQHGDMRIFGYPTAEHDPAEVFKIALTELAPRTDHFSAEDQPINAKVFREEVQGLLRWFNTVLEANKHGTYPILNARIEMLELTRFSELLKKLDDWLAPGQ